MKPKIYIFSIFCWDSNLLHREHMLARSFDRLGYQVCFVERSYKTVSGRSRKVGNIEVKTVFGLPYLRGYSLSVFRLNDFMIKKQLMKLMDPHEEAWLILSSPLWAKSVYAIKSEGQKLIYDISDDHLAFTTNDIWRKNLKSYEEFLVDKADLITLTSEILLGKIPKSKKYKLLENGVDLESFSKANPILKDRFRGKIVGFIGGVYPRVNLDLIEECGREYPEVQFMVVGPTDQKEKLKELEHLANFHYLGPIPWDSIQDYFASLDVGVIPFVSEAEYPWLKTVDPVKVYQYSYFGYPIVTTDFGQIRKLEPLIKVASSENDFIQLVGEALRGKEAINLKKGRLVLARNHDWLEIAKVMAATISSAEKPIS